MSPYPAKLILLAAEEGLSAFELIERDTYDSVVSGICTNPGCKYTTQVEPDSDSGFCEECGTNTVTSSLRLAGMI